jgi:hypothetical protein
VIFFFVAGFGGYMPVEAYGDVLGRVASGGGYVVVGIDRELELSAINYTTVALSLDPVVAWINDAGEGGAEALLRANGLVSSGVSGVGRRIAFGGQSAGCHIAVQRLVSRGCERAGAAVLIDPVDGEDPFGHVTNGEPQPPCRELFLRCADYGSACPLLPPP